MGTYTTNYQLYTPSVGETGWGELVNGNFTTIDTAMKSLSNRIGTLEPLSVIQVDENQNVVFPAKIYSENGIIGKILIDYNTNSTQNLKLYEISFGDNYYAEQRTGTITVNLSSVSKITYNASLFDFKGTPPTTVVTTVTLGGHSQGISVTITVTDNTTGETVLNTGLYASNGGWNNVTFERIIDHSYNVTYVPSNSYVQYKVNVNTPNVTYYVA